MRLTGRNDMRDEPQYQDPERREPRRREVLPIRRHERENVQDRADRVEQRRERRPIKKIEMRRTNEFVDGLWSQLRSGNPRYRKK